MYRPIGPATATLAATAASAALTFTLSSGSKMRRRKILSPRLRPLQAKAQQPPERLPAGCPCTFALPLPGGYAGDVFQGTCRPNDSPNNSTRSAVPIPDGPGILRSGLGPEGLTTSGTWFFDEATGALCVTSEAKILAGGCCYMGTVAPVDGSLVPQGNGTQTCRGATRVGPRLARTVSRHEGEWSAGALLNGVATHVVYFNDNIDTNYACRMNESVFESEQQGEVYCQLSMRLQEGFPMGVTRSGTCAGGQKLQEAVEVDPNLSAEQMSDYLFALIGRKIYPPHQLEAASDVAPTDPQRRSPSWSSAGLVLAGATPFTGGAYAGATDKSGLPHGNGKILGYVTGTGPLYEGMWEHGIPHGTGHWRDIDGSERVGTFERGVLREGMHSFCNILEEDEDTLLTLSTSLFRGSWSVGTFDGDALVNGVRWLEYPDSTAVIATVKNRTVDAVEVVSLNAAGQVVREQAMVVQPK